MSALGHDLEAGVIIRPMLTHTRATDLFLGDCTRRLVIVSPTGTECPIGQPSDWTVLEVANLLGEIDRLPVVEPGSWRA